MIRIKDQEKSLKFYQEVMGMRLMRVSENKDANFNLYFLAYSKEVSFTHACFTTLYTNRRRHRQSRLPMVSTPSPTVRACLS